MCGETQGDASGSRRPGGEGAREATVRTHVPKFDGEDPERPRGTQRKERQEAVIWGSFLIFEQLKQFHCYSNITFAFEED